MEPIANLNGKILPLAEAQVSALDRGFLFGDAVYEGMHLADGRIRFVEDHFARLARSLGEMLIAGVDLVRLRSRLHETIAASGCADAFIYLQISRGAGPRRTHYFPDPPVPPTEFFFVEPFRDPYGQGRTEGIAVITHPDLRWGRCDVKSVNLLGNVMAAQAAREAGAAEAVLIKPDGTVTECSRSSLFGVVADVVRTFPKDPAILPGVTRGRVLQLIRDLKIPLEERAMSEAELRGASELFLTGTTAEVLPVATLDGKPVGDGKPGPVARRLQAEFAARFGGKE